MELENNKKRTFNDINSSSSSTDTSSSDSKSLCDSSVEEIADMIAEAISKNSSSKSPLN